MVLNKIKLFKSVFFIVWLSQLAFMAPQYEYDDAENNYKIDYDAECKSNTEKYKDNGRRQVKIVDSKIDHSNPYRIVKTGVREWTNFEHSRPLKRADDPPSNPVSNPHVSDNLEGLNISNPISKSHCPINLLYGNNLTVKNYFLLMPRGNASCNDTLLQLQSSEDNFEKTFVSLSPQPNITVQNEIGTLPFNLDSEGTTQAASSESTTSAVEVSTSSTNITNIFTQGTAQDTMIVTTSFDTSSYSQLDQSPSKFDNFPNISTVSTSTVSLEFPNNSQLDQNTTKHEMSSADSQTVSDSTALHGGEIVNITIAYELVTYSQSDINASTDITATPSTATDSTPALGGDQTISKFEHSSAGLAATDNSTAPGVGLSLEVTGFIAPETSITPTNYGTLTTSVNITQENITTFSPLAEVSSSKDFQSVGQTQTTLSMIMNNSNDILRTVDKYCETFNISDNGPYTINPVSIGQQETHVNDLLVDKSSFKHRAAGGKKHKRTVKHARRNKRHSLRQQ